MSHRAFSPTTLDASPVHHYPEPQKPLICYCPHNCAFPRVSEPGSDVWPAQTGFFPSVTSAQASSRPFLCSGRTAVCSSVTCWRLSSFQVRRFRGRVLQTSACGFSCGRFPAAGPMVRGCLFCETSLSCHPSVGVPAAPRPPSTCGRSDRCAAVSCHLGHTDRAGSGRPGSSREEAQRRSSLAVGEVEEPGTPEGDPSLPLALCHPVP